MNLSRVFIEPPVGTALVTLGVALAGFIAFFLLPVAPLPQVEFPTISVSATLPGASPDTMAATVATPLERALGSIAGVNEITSSSSLGSTHVTLQFDLDRSIDGAARDVQAALNAARSLLPSGLPGNPQYRKVNPADAPVLIIALTSDTLTRGQMYDAASTVLAQRLSQVDGIGQVTIGGGALPAVRIELDPNRLAANGIALDNVRASVVATNANRPKGAVEDAGHYWQLGANDQGRTAADYAPLVLSFRNGAAVRLRDVADVSDSVQDVRNYGLSNGKAAVLLILNKAPGANIIETVDTVRSLLPQLRASISPAINVDVVVDRSPTIRASIHEVERTLVIACGLVIVVVFAFLRNVRAALLPAVAVPVSLAGTFGVMFLLGYSIDNLSLMAMTVATGFVVDDAIVVLENIARHVERGLSPREAALLGAREIGFTVLTISLSLIAAFIPILAMGGLIGRLFREFAVVLSVAILESMAVSLTTTPMMAATLLRPVDRARERPGRVARALAGSQRAVMRGYRRSLRWTLRHQPIALLVLAAVIVLNVTLYITSPKAFFPQQDTGRLIGFVQADQSSSFQAMQKKVIAFSDIVRADPAVDTATGFIGGGQRNTASMFISLKPLAERGEGVDAVIDRLRGKLAHLPGANLFLVPVQDIRIGGRQSNASWQYTLQADELADLRAWEPRIRQALSQLPELTDVNSDQQDHGAQTSLVFDRDAVARLGLSMSVIDNTLNDAFGQRQVGVIYNPLNQYRVVMELAPDYLQSPETLKQLTFTNASGEQVPLAALARVETTSTPLSVNHQSGTPASTVSFNLAPDVSLSEAVDAINQAVARLNVPVSVRGNFQGTARAYQASLSSEPLLIGAAVVAIYLVLGMLYESLIHPVTILSTLPSAGVGALLALLLFKTPFTIIALIGVVLLIGIVKKNAIMMIDFALSAQRAAARRGSSRSAGAAIYRAAVLRMRPILMTTLAAVFGAIPLALGTGDGAELRQPLGIAIVGGLLLSQLLTLYTTPVVFVCMDRLRGLRRVWLLAFPLALSACASAPPAPPPAFTAPATFKEDGLWKRAAATTAAATVPEAWWRTFQDPVLDGLQDQLVIGNENLKNAVAQVASARASLLSSQAASWPTLSLTASGSPGGSGISRSDTTALSLGASASWELDLWGRLSTAARSVEARLQASSDDLAAARLSAQATLVQTYLAMRAAEAQEALLDRTVAADARTLELTQARYESGVVSQSDVLQAQTQLRTVQAQRKEASLQRAQLEHAIAVLLGKAPAELTIARTSALPSLPPVPELLPATLLERRPDIAAAERSVAAAYAQIGVADAAFFPSLTLSADAGYRSSSLGNLLRASKLLWSIGPTLAATLFDGGARQAASDQARAAADQAVSSYRQTVLTALQEVEDNLVVADHLGDELQLQRDALQAAQRNLEITQDQYKAGTVSYLNVATAQTAVLTSEGSLLSLQNRQLAAASQLLKNIAGRWSS